MAQQGDHIYFGSLEEQERQRIEEEENNNDNISLASQTTKATLGQPPQQQQQRGINLDQLLPPPVSGGNSAPLLPPIQPNSLNNNGTLETIQFSEESLREKERHQEALKALELKQALNKIQLPTQDIEVKHRLRELGEPICYFGERPLDRRERLRQKCAEYMIQKGEMPTFKAIENQSTENEEHEHFRYLGPAELKNVRKNIVEHTLKAAALRIEKEKLRQAQYEPLEQEDELIKENFEASKYSLFMSQFGDTSAISKGDFCKNGQFFATAGGSGACKIWNIPDCDLKSDLNGHLSKVHDIKFHPMSCLGLDEASYANIATCSSDQNIRLWTFKQDKQFQKSLVLSGHEDRVNKAVFHPCGDYLFSSSHDNTWKFWDLETQKAIITQTGHASAVYALAIHPDGSLIFSGDFCGQGVIWDIRSGRNILNLQGHVKNILCADFNSNGYQMASGGDDNSIRFWDIRRKHCAKIVPGHLKLVSDLKYQPGKSMFLASVSYDNTIKLWNSQTFEMSANLGKQETKLTGVSICEETGYMATTSLDRKFSLWEKFLD